MKWSAEIYVKPHDVWDLIEDAINDEEIWDEAIAYDSFDDTEICVSVNKGTASIAVFQGDDAIDTVEVYGANDCECVVSEIYESYLGDNTPIKESRIDDEDELKDIDDREQELADSVYQMLDVFVPNLDEVANDTEDEIIDDLASLICEYLYRRRGISVYRPMFLDDGTKNGYFTEHPYAEIDYDNP